MTESTENVVIGWQDNMETHSSGGELYTNHNITKKHIDGVSRVNENV